MQRSKPLTVPLSRQAQIKIDYDNAIKALAEVSRLLPGAIFTRLSRAGAIDYGDIADLNKLASDLRDIVTQLNGK